VGTIAIEVCHDASFDMSKLIIYDPGNWLSTFGFKTLGQVYSNEKDALAQTGTHISILDFVNPEPCNHKCYNMIIWAALENINFFWHRLPLSGRDWVVSPTVADPDRSICNPSLCYSLAYQCRGHYFKPQIQVSMWADMIVGRILTDQHEIRARCLYELLNRGWQHHVIVTAREIDFNAIPDDINQSSVWQQQLPNYDHYESHIFSNNFHGDIKLLFGDVISKDPELVMPWRIYQNSLYSVVIVDSRGYYLDEKIARPMIATRPFIVMGPAGYLQALRNLGFATFDPVIDESYDLEPNDQRRYSMALDSLGKLANQNSQSVYDRLKKRLQHNRKLVYNCEYWANRLKDWLNDSIKKETGIQCAIY
jgi:hypothetical protein